MARFTYTDALRKTAAGFGVDSDSAVVGSFVQKGSRRDGNAAPLTPEQLEQRRKEQAAAARTRRAEALKAEQKAFAQSEAERARTRAAQTKAYQGSGAGSMKGLEEARKNNPSFGRKQLDIDSPAYYAAVPNPVDYTDEQLEKWIGDYNHKFNTTYTLDRLYGDLQSSYETGWNAHRDAREAARRSWFNPRRWTDGEIDNGMLADRAMAEAGGGSPSDAWNKMLYQARQAGMNGRVNPYASASRMKQESLGLNTAVQDRTRSAEDGARIGEAGQYLANRALNGITSIVGVRGGDLATGVGNYLWNGEWKTGEDIRKDYMRSAQERFGELTGQNYYGNLGLAGDATELGTTLLTAFAVGGQGGPMARLANFAKANRRTLAGKGASILANTLRSGQWTQPRAAAIDLLSGQMTPDGMLPGLSGMKGAVDLANTLLLRTRPEDALIDTGIIPAARAYLRLGRMALKNVPRVANTIAKLQAFASRHGSIQALNAFIQKASGTWIGKKVADMPRQFAKWTGINTLSSLSRGELPGLSTLSESAKMSLGTVPGLVIGVGAPVAESVLAGTTAAGAVAASEEQPLADGSGSGYTRAQLDDKEFSDALASPGGRSRLLQETGLPETATDEQLRTGYDRQLSLIRQNEAESDAAAAAFPDLVGMPDELAAQWKALSSEDRGKHKFKAYRSQAMAGGVMPVLMMSDKELSHAQRRELFEITMGKYAKEAGRGVTGMFWDHVTGNDADIVWDAVKDNPRAMGTLVSYAGAEIRDMVQGRTPEALGSVMLKDYKPLLDRLPPGKVAEMFSPMLYDEDTTGAQVVAFMRSASKNGIEYPELKKAFGQAVAERMFGGRKNPAGKGGGDFAAEFLSEFSTALASGEGISESDAKIVADIARSVDTDSFRNMFYTMTPENKEKMARAVCAASGQDSELAKSLPPEDLQRLKAAAEPAVQEAAMDYVMQNPLENIPKATGLWLRSKGYGGLADAAENPLLFYGTLLLTLMGSLWLGNGLFGGNGGREEKETVFGALSKKRSELADSTFGGMSTYGL